MSEIRSSRARSYFFGNLSVLETLYEWGNSPGPILSIGNQVYEATVHVVYMYGQPELVLASWINYQDLLATGSGQFGYPLGLNSGLISIQSSLPPTWEGILTDWFKVRNADLNAQSFSQDDCLVLVDVTRSSTPAQINYARVLSERTISAGGHVIAFVQNGDKFPSGFNPRICVITTNSHNSFNLSLVENAMMVQSTERIFVYGLSSRVFGHAIGAVDILAKYDSAQSPIELLSQKVIFDKASSMGAHGFVNFSQLCNYFGSGVDLPVPMEVTSLDFDNDKEGRVILTPGISLRKV